LLHFLYTVAKVAFASLVAGAILGHFGISSEQIMTLVGLTPERLQELTQRALAWALPNVTLGALVIVPIWFLAFLFRPPRRSND
jgi:H+/Cl- antiporter ClcA